MYRGVVVGHIWFFEYVYGDVVGFGLVCDLLVRLVD